MFKITLEDSSFQTDSLVEANLFSKNLYLAQTIPKPETLGDKVPLRLYDPGYKNTAVCKTKIYSDYRIRGYAIEELFEKSSFLEVAFLLIYGKLPGKEDLSTWCESVMTHTYLHHGMEKQMETFRYDSHPMAMLIATISSLSTFTPDANPAIQAQDMYMASNSSHLANRNKLIFRALGKVPTIAANVYRHRIGRIYNHPMPNSLSYCENLLFMMDKLNEINYTPDPRLVKILDKMFILLCEDGVTCSTVMMRHLASSGVDPYTALSGAAGALFGERKTAVIVELITKKIKSLENLDSFLAGFKNGKCDKLDGFEITTKMDPRVPLAKSIVLELFDLLSCNTTATIAVELEKRVKQDDWFISRNYRPTVIIFHLLID
jgi:citrate synthase